MVQKEYLQNKNITKVQDTTMQQKTKKGLKNEKYLSSLINKQDATVALIRLDRYSLF